MPDNAATIRCGPSNTYDSAKNGSGGIRLPHTTSPTRSTLPTFFVTMLPSAHEHAAHNVSTKPASVIAWPPCMPITASPAAAISKPTTFGKRKRSCRKSAAKISVKNACACNTSEASPAGMPTYIAENRNANWPKRNRRAVREQPAPRQLRPLHEKHRGHRRERETQCAEQHRRHTMQAHLDHDEIDAPREHHDQREQQIPGRHPRLHDCSIRQFSGAVQLRSTALAADSSERARGTGGKRRYAALRSRIVH